MSIVSPTIPPDDPKRTLTLAQPDKLPHIGLVGDTYTITVSGEDTNGTFLPDRYAYPSRRWAATAPA